MIGCVTSSLFSLFLAIGTFAVRPHRDTLPTSVERCNVSASLPQTETMRDLWTTVSSVSVQWNRTERELVTTDHSLMSSTLLYDSEPTWTTADQYSASYVQQL